MTKGQIVYIVGNTDGDSGYYHIEVFINEKDAEKEKQKRGAYAEVFEVKVK